MGFNVCTNCIVRTLVFVKITHRILMLILTPNNNRLLGLHNCTSSRPRYRVRYFVVFRTRSEECPALFIHTHSYIIIIVSVSVFIDSMNKIYKSCLIFDGNDDSDFLTSFIIRDITFIEVYAGTEPIHIIPIF